DVLDELAADLRAGRREHFALTVGLMLPHAPFVARKEDFDRFAGRVGLAERRAPANGHPHPWLSEWSGHRDIIDVTDEEERRARTAYYALVFSMDRMIGRLLDRLDALGLRDDTLVVYTSDHGEQIGEHGLWWKHTFYEDSVRVPLIMALPGSLPEGQRRDQVVNLIDVTATMLEATGAPPLTNGDGVSFWRLAQDDAVPWQNLTYSEYCQGSRFDWGIPGTTQARMVRFGRYKLNYYHRMPPQLFDLQDDPDEMNDLADARHHAAVRAQLVREALRGWDPDEIEARIEQRIADKAILRDWANQVEPPSTHLWPMRADHNRLDT
ncbi:MAG: sulfatase-like hydrolase/transferase, partial [Pseudomonadota bacterium]